MAEHNFSAAMRMTMANVVGNYLRWFELKRAKKAIGAALSFSDGPFSWRRSGFPRPGAKPHEEEDKNSREPVQESSGKSVR